LNCKNFIYLYTVYLEQKYVYSTWHSS